MGESGDIAVLSLRGIIDTVSAERLREAIARVIDSGIHRIVVDMSQVEYVSSGGWGTFTERLREVRRAGGDIKLFGMDPDVYYVFTMLGFNIVLSSFDILAEAIDDFAREPDAERPVQPPGGAPETPSVPSYDAPPRGEGEVPSAPPDDSSPGTVGSPTPPAANEVSPLARLASTPASRSDASGPDATPPLSDGAPLPAARADAEVIEWVTRRGVVVAVLHGAIEASAADVIGRSLGAVLAARPRAVVFDLSDVSYVSSTGWGRFAECVESVRGWNGRVALCGLREDLHEIYACLEFRAFLPAFVTLDEAVAALRDGGDGSPGASGDAAARAASPAVDAPGPTVADASTSPAARPDAPGPAGEGTGREAPAVPVSPADLDAILGGDEVAAPGGPDAPFSPAPPLPAEPGTGAPADATVGPDTLPGPDEAAIDPAAGSDPAPAIEPGPTIEPMGGSAGPETGDWPDVPSTPDGAGPPAGAAGAQGAPGPDDHAATPPNASATPAAGPEGDVGFDAATPSTIDVERASDAVAGNDERLRRMGWKAYGERLRRRRGRREDED